MNQMSKYKIKNPYITSVADITKRVRNQMHGKPFVERLIPGIAVQFQAKRELLVDFNPSMGYKISGKWSAGTGWVERVQFHHLYSTVPAGRVFGLRTFTNIELGSGIAFRAEVERINAYLPPIQINGRSEGYRQWMWGAFVGLKKRLPFYKRSKWQPADTLLFHKAAGRRKSLCEQVERSNGI